MDNKNYNELVQKLSSTFSGFPMGSFTMEHCHELLNTTIYNNDGKPQNMEVALLLDASKEDSTKNNLLLVVSSLKKENNHSMRVYMPINQDKLNTLIDYTTSDEVNHSVLKEMKEKYENFVNTQKEVFSQVNTLLQKVKANRGETENNIPTKKHTM